MYEIVSSVFIFFEKDNWGTVTILVEAPNS